MHYLNIEIRVPMLYIIKQTFSNEALYTIFLNKFKVNL